MTHCKLCGNHLAYRFQNKRGQFIYLCGECCANFLTYTVKRDDNLVTKLKDYTHEKITSDLRG